MRRPGLRSLVAAPLASHRLAVDNAHLVRSLGACRSPLFPKIHLSLPGDFEVVVKVRSEHTDGVMAVIEETIQPGRLVSPHTHDNDVWVYVLSGEIGVLVGDTDGDRGPGQLGAEAAQVVHAMWNSATVPARVVEVLTPGGSERWFEELAGLASGDHGRVRRRVQSVRHSHSSARLAMDGRAP